MTSASWSSFRLNLCVPVTGSFDEVTRAAIAKMQDGLRVSQTRKISGQTEKKRALGGRAGCGGFRDAFEKFHFRSDTNDPDAKVKSFNAKLSDCAKNLAQSSNGALSAPSGLASIKASGILDEPARDVIDFVLLNVAKTVEADATGALNRLNIRAITICSPRPST